MLTTFGGMLFPSHKPRDFGYGLKSGVFNIGSGVLSGATALVSLPAMGARQGGAKGFAQGNSMVLHWVYQTNVYFSRKLILLHSRFVLAIRTCS